MRSKLKRIFSVLVVSAIMVPSFSYIKTNPVEAARTDGSAPYTNQWAVTGPFTNEQSLGNIVPVIGNSFADPNSTETSTWQYFDDRIFNRNYDDYNDLMGYFDVKQGQNTLNKWVVAGTYVYSPTAQTVQWQVGGSGVYKLFANDILSGQQTQIPGRLNKTGTRYPIALKQGWNKIFIEIQHKNPGNNKNFLGFYTRLSDNNGNEIPGLTYSVLGPNVSNNQLKVVTQGLAIDKNAFDARNANVPANDYPSNTLPYAYDENPYVWMVGKIDDKLNTSSNAPQATSFKFQAAGGNPSYTWEIAGGQLPPGLTLASDGHIDGKVADGAHGTSQKDYTFTVKVTDAQGSTATNQYTITVKQNPVDWFIEGKMSALSHTTGTMPNLYDPNFNYDEWAQTAKEMGMTLLSTESLQNTIYYWPSPNAKLTPDDSNKMYKYNALYQTEDSAWHVKDRVMQAKQAVERYGMKFGVYVSSLYEGGEILESDIQGLVARYNPWYLFADGGPEGYSNIDVAWSSARNYNDRVLIDANPSAQTGDQDITLHERPFWHSEAYTDGGWSDHVLPQERKVAHEEWNDPYTTALDVWTIYANGNERDNWAEATKEMINQYGHGYVMNYDSSITVTRGMDNLSSNLDNTNIFAMQPISSQQLSDMRSSIVKWMANAGGPDLRESMYGTMPYTMDYTIKSGWYTDPQKAIAHGQGPDWGYAMSRNQYVYMHMINNMISGVSKTGFTGQAAMSGIGPFDYPVDKVELLNKGVSLPFTTQQNNGKSYITIDTSSVVADPIDTIIKITTKNPARNYKMTSVKLFSSQTEPNKLQLRAESYMNNYTNIFAPATLNYTSDKTSVATVDAATGLVTAVGNGAATITVTATYNDGVNATQVKTDTYPVKVSGGAISAALPLVGVNMFTKGALFWGQFSTNQDLPVTFKGFTEKGGAVDILGGTNIKYHYATVDGNRNNSAGKIIVTEVPAAQVPFVVNGNTMQFTGKVSTPTMYSYWADITVDGKTYTTTRNYLTLIPDVNVAAGITPTVTSNSSNADKLSDGKINDSTGGNLSKWVPQASDANPSITYDLGKLQKLNRVNIFFNHRMPNANNVTYYNVPNKVKIEYSVDGTNWIAGNETNTLSGGGLPTSRNTLAVPKSDTTLYAWEQEGLYYNYPVDPSKPSAPARYVRISFPGGGQGGSPIDILEAQVFSSGEPVVSNVVSITAPAAATVLSGTAKTAAALGLPTSVTVVTNSGTEYADVTWNVGAANYNPAVSTPQAFTVSGTVTLPSWVVNPNNVALTTSISVATTKVSTSYKAMWGFNSNGNDNSSNGFNATVNGTGTTYSSSAKKEGSASLSLDGKSGSYAKANLVTTKTDNITLSAWVKWNGATSSGQQILLNGNTSGSGYSIFLDHGNSDKVSILLGGKAVIGSNTALPVGQWTNVTGVRRNGTWELYVNGNSVLSSANSSSPNTPGTGTFIGGNQNGVENFNGFIDAARIYETALTPIEIQAIANEDDTIVSVPVATLSDAGTVTAGQPFELRAGLSNVTDSVYQSVYAQELTLHFDSAKLQFESVTSVKDGFQVIDKKETAPGQIRIVAASVGANVPAQGDVLTFKFTAKSVAQATNTSISVDHIVISNAQGNELQVGSSSREIQITVPSIPVDKSLLNGAIANAQVKYDAAVEGSGDGLYAIGSKAQLQSAINAAKAAANASNATQQQVDSAKAALEAAVQVFDTQRITANVNGQGGITIGDLAMVSAAYGKVQGQIGWNEKADVNHDGKVDVEDLAIVAKAILK